MTALTPAEFQQQTGVSRETLERLQAYADLLASWNRRINLVGPRTIEDLWRRHLLDSAQLKTYIPAAAVPLLDLGSGAGLPGLILAILGVPDVHLVEADARKAAFLREAARVTGARVTLHSRRIEDLAPMRAGAITARAFAPLGELLNYAAKFLDNHTILLLLKGRSVEEELTEARKGWKMTATAHRSLSDPSGTILQLTQVTRAD